MKKKIIGCTSGRADFGILKNLFHKVDNNNNFDLTILAIGSHFNREYGHSFNEVKNMNFKKVKKIKINSKFSNINSSIKFSAQLMNSFSIFIQKIKPDFIILLGDRFETFFLAVTAYFNNINIIHLHGGELTFGSFDEGFRHSITKMSAMHFVSNLIHKKRVIQLGENPKFVYDVGSLSCENIKEFNFFNKAQIQNKLSIKLKKNNFIVVYHPETISNQNQVKNFNEILKAIKKFKDSLFVFTMPNIDPENKKISQMIKNFVIKNGKNFKYFENLGYETFISLLKLCDGIIGNSSSGIIEAPSLKTGVINIGSRQEGRLKSKSVISCKPKHNEIFNNINKIITTRYKTKIKSFKNPYEKGKTSEKIMSKIINFDLKKYKFKKFYDL